METYFKKYMIYWNLKQNYKKYLKIKIILKNKIYVMIFIEKTTFFQNHLPVKK